MVKENVTHYQVLGERKNQINTKSNGGFKQSKGIKSKTKKAKQQEEKRELLDWQSKTQKRKMLTSQIKFRQLVLEQSAGKKTFQISRFEGKPVTVDMLISNLEILIRLKNVSGKSLFLQLINQVH